MRETLFICVYYKKRKPLFDKICQYLTKNVISDNSLNK